MELISYTQISGNLRRTAEKGYISLLNKKQIENLALKYFGIKDGNGKYIGYMCPYSGKIYSKKSNLVLEHIIPVDSKGGTVLFNCIPTSIEVNKKSEKGVKHLLSWWTNSKYWDNEAPIRLNKLVNYILEAYELVFKEYSVEEIEESYQEVLETEDDLTTSKRKKEQTHEQTQNNTIHSYLGFLLDCIKQLEKENINIIEINIKLKELEEKNIFQDIEKYTLFQNILKQVIKKFTGDDTKAYLSYSIKFDIKKLMDSIPYNNEQEIYNEIFSRLVNIQELLEQNNLVIKEYFNSLKEIEKINLLYKPVNTISVGVKEKFLSCIKLGFDTKLNEFIEMLNNGYIPKKYDKDTQFSNGDLINFFWSDNKEKIKETLITKNKYNEGYEFAKNIIINLNIDKISEYIELLNQGYVPKSRDIITKFSNGDAINQFWPNHKQKIKERFETEAKYKEGYEIANTILKNLEIDKISEYIELLNQGYIPKSIDKEISFSNGDLINYFWSDHKEKIKETLKTGKKYKGGYEIAKQTIYDIENPIDKISEYIELLNQGYIPKYKDLEINFSNGDLVNIFWNNHKGEIKEKLETEEKYKDGYELAKTILKNLDKFSNKISEYIELLNQGYVPKKVDKDIRFSNGDLINYFWSSNKETIKEQLETEEKYKEGYELAKSIIKKIVIPVNKVSELIELLNQGYIPKSTDNKTRFSNGDLVNNFWNNHKDKIKEKLEKEEKYKEGYELAKKTLNYLDKSLDKISEYIELLNQGYIPKSADNKTYFSNGDLVNNFWNNHKDKIKEKLETENKYKEGYELAKNTLKNLDKSSNKISEFIDLLNQGYVPKSTDKKTHFSNGDIINNFWWNHKEQIKTKLETEEKYKDGYEHAKKTLKNLEIDKISEFIELLNQGYVPKQKDIKVQFSNGDFINQYWSTNKNKIKEKLETEDKYIEGYEIAKQTLKNLEIDKISEFIELLNQGYIPKSIDRETRFSNGDSINYFWSSNKEKINKILSIEEKYKIGYEIAKQTIYDIENPIDKISEYIDLLNHGYIPKYKDLEINFSNGEFINYFWNDNKEKIISKLFNELLEDSIYDKARQTILNYFKVKTIEEYYELEQKKKQLKELKNMKQNLENIDNSLEINETISRKRA